MGQPYVGEIRMFAGSFAPAGWAFCSGQTLPISENDVLFQLIGTTYGGDGQETFNLPDLRGRLPLHMGTGKFGNTYQIGESAGTESVTLSTQQIPNHTHSFRASNDIANSGSPNNSVIGVSSSTSVFIADLASEPMKPALSPVGGNQPHENMQPFLCISFIISLFGIFPSQT
ncbi:phage tail protein [Dyadobacter fermentans]|uniref:Tail Collar domain protein n=1 Tax=Dyadobacter fermentans (strain ATCC 700827 / DSM 18053 / CIP 107007 / KCTC 52180 / NS114) TaxID=471854 RepID=C6W6X6_DYAFD|nr:tail fiber protein [Dyadobacter fermentans]ACT92585.1 Tail Collar domain protein [Dyadobacter fermentans DSM 18053]